MFLLSHLLLSSCIVFRNSYLMLSVSCLPHVLPSLVFIAYLIFHLILFSSHSVIFVFIPFLVFRVCSLQGSTSFSLLCFVFTFHSSLFLNTYLFASFYLASFNICLCPFSIVGCSLQDVIFNLLIPDKSFPHLTFHFFTLTYIFPQSVTFSFIHYASFLTFVFLFRDLTCNFCFIPSPNALTSSSLIFSLVPSENLIPKHFAIHLYNFAENRNKGECIYLKT